MEKPALEVDATALLMPSFENPDHFANLIDEFLEHLPAYRPDIWGTEEPLNLKFDSIQRRFFLRRGIPDIMWRRHGRMDGEGRFQRAVRAIQGDQHAFSWLSVSSFEAVEVEEIIAYLQFLAVTFGAEYAFCDTLNDRYKSTAARNGFAPHGLMDVFTHKLRRWLPDIAWAQIFGPAYVELFGIDKLLSSPAHVVKRLGEKSVYIQLTPSLFDVRDDFDRVSRVRHAVKRHLDNNIFFDPHNARGHVYRVPVFEFEE